MFHKYVCSFDEQNSHLICPGADALPNGLDVTFEVTEIKRLTGSYNTMVGNNEGSMVRKHNMKSGISYCLYSLLEVYTQLMSMLLRYWV